MDDPLDRIAWPVRTERLLLRRLAPGDVAATWEYRKLPEVCEWITAGPTDFESYRRTYLQSDRLLRDLAVVLRHEGEERLIGTVKVKIHDARAQAEMADQARFVEAELGWCFHPEFGGVGFAAEAVRAVVDQCFGPLGLRRVTARCFAANEPSWRLMERIGMRREAYTRADALHRSGRWMDGMSYALLADEWEA